jgi:TraM protein, DNA-binding
MPRLQTFVSARTEKEIVNIVSAKKSEGARTEESNISSVTAMLVELGLKVYQLQQTKEEGGFNQTEFNKTLLENIVMSNVINKNLFAINSYNSEIQGMDKYEYKAMTESIKAEVALMMDRFFPLNFS